MMHKLAAKATGISRSIFASLPWGYRVAHLFTKMAADTQDAFGRFVYAEFIKAGVQGMPDINGAPALDFQTKVQGPRGADRLPKGYGKAFGVKVWRTGLAKLKSPDVLEEALSLVMMNFVRGKFKINEGSTLSSAESLVITSVLNAGYDVIRKTKGRGKHQRPDDVSLTDDAGLSQIDITDPHAFHRLNDMIPRTEMRRIMQELYRVHAKAPEWVEAQLEGLTNTELAAQWGVSIPYVSKWIRQYVPDIKGVFYRHLKDVA